MARYRSRDETDMAWNKIRRRLTRELDTQIYDWREEALNKLLTEAWVHYAKSLEKGEVLQLESGYEKFVGTALDEHVHVHADVD